MIRLGGNEKTRGSLATLLEKARALPHVLGSTLLAVSLALSACSKVTPTVSPDRRIASFNHLSQGVQKCIDCHVGDRPLVPVGSNPPFDHTSAGATGDCVTCHTDPAKMGVTWAGGIYHASLTSQPQTCLNCHSTEKPNITTPATPLPANDGQFMSHTSSQVVAECSTCHAGDLAQLSTQHLWGHSWDQAGNPVIDSFHSVVPNPTSCQECHGMQNGSAAPGVGNNLPAGTVNSTSVSAPSVTMDNSYDQINHQDPNVAQNDCLSCHTNSGKKTPAGASSGTPPWRAATFHTTPTGSARPLNSGTQCMNCHSGNIPKDPSTANGKDHSGLIALKQDCSSCHAYPGTGAAGASANWLGATDAVPTAAYPVLANLINVNVSIPTFVGTTITQAQQTTEPLIPYMAHFSTQISSSTRSNCATCHNGQNKPDGGSMPAATFHKSMTAAGLSQPTSCNECHGQLPQDFVGAQLNTAVTPNTFRMRHNAVIWDTTTGILAPNLALPLVSNECATCHTAPADAAGASWSLAPFSVTKVVGASGNAYYHAALTAQSLSQPVSCIDCHANKRPGGPIVAAAPLPTGVNAPSGQTSYDHAQGGLGNCSTCHSTPADGTKANWINGSYHSTLSAQPTSCGSCHNNNVPSSVTVSNIDFQHMYHASTQITQLVTNGILECSVCHTADLNTSPRNWSKADSFHASFSNAGKSLSACLDCHSSDSPGATLKDSATSVALSSNTIPTTDSYAQVNHADLNVVGKDCVLCHTNAGNRTPAGAAAGTPPWKAAGFHANVTQVQISLAGPTSGRCDNCHSNNKPTAQLTSGMDHSQIGSMDCSSCHSYPGKSNGSLATPNWLGASSAPNTPVYDQSGSQDFSLNLYQPSFTGTTMTVTGPTVTPIHEWMNHSSGAVSSLLVNCTNCHTGASASGDTMKLAKLHANLTTQPTACVDCHNSALQYSSKPTAGSLAGPVVSSRSPASPEMNHDAVTWLNSNGSWAPQTTTPIVPTSMDCASCHVVPTSNYSNISNARAPWSGAQFHSSMPTQPTSCLDCHANSRPIGLAPSPVPSPLPSNTTPFDHAANSGAGMGDCVSCHTTSASTKLWSSGKYHASLSNQPSSCVSCHMVNEPQGITVSANDGQHMNHLSSQLAQLTVPPQAQNTLECSTCHSSDVNSNPRVWSQFDQFHVGFKNAGKTLNSCTDCHSADSPGSTLKDSTTTVAMDVTYTLADNYAQISHSDPNVSSRDCIVCHTNQGMTAGTGTKWKAATFHTALANVSNLTLTCANCHSNNKPTGSSQPPLQDHRQIGSQDCSGCHSYPGAAGGVQTPNWLGAKSFPPNPVSDPAGLTGPSGLENYSTAIYQGTFSAPATPSGLPATILSVASSTITIQNWMNHSSSQVSSIISTCTTCHSATGSFTAPYTKAPAVFHKNVSSQPTSCADCHNAVVGNSIYTTKPPAGSFIGPVNSTRSPASSEMKHEAVTWSNSGGTWAKTANSIIPSTLDCKACHAVSQGDGKTTWAQNTVGSVSTGTKFHANMANQQLNSCLDCHANSRPSGAVPQAAFANNSTPFNHLDASGLGLGDCVSCHTGAAASGSWSGGAFHASIASIAGASQPATCVNCHGGTIPNGNMPGTTTQSSITPKTTPTPMPTWASPVTSQHMSHTSSQVALVSSSSECVTCHTSDVNSSPRAWSKADSFHAAVAHAGTTLTSCSDCHGLGNGSTQLGSGNDTPSTVVNAPSKFSANYSGYTPTLVGSDTTPDASDRISHADRNVLGTDCITCHASNQDSNWAGASFHKNVTLQISTAAVTISGLSTTGRCDNCHMNLKPAGANQPTGLDHRNIGTQDCSTCHAYNPSKPSWLTATGMPTGIVYDQSGSQSLAITAYNPNYSTPTANPSSTPAVGPTMNTPVPLASLSLHEGMDHSQTGLSASQMSTCSTCHNLDSTVVTPNSVSRAFFHANVTSQPTSCNACHSVTMPTGFVGPVDPNRSPATSQMNHAAVSYTLTSGVYKPSTTSSLVTQDCTVCHGAAPTTSPALGTVPSPTPWSVTTSGGAVFFHSSLGTSQPGSCLDCHSNNRPSAAYPTPANSSAPSVQYLHAAANGGTGDCVSCHTVPQNSLTATWKPGHFHATAGVQASCNSCHDVAPHSERPNSTTGWVSTTFSSSSAPFDYTTHGGTLDCATCHANPTLGSTPTSANWANGNYVHSTAKPATCASCHSTQVNNSKFNHSTCTSTLDCASCHTAAATAVKTAGHAPVLADWAGAIDGTAQSSPVLGSLAVTAYAIPSPVPSKLPTPVPSQPIYVQMVHSSSALPAEVQWTATSSPNCGTCHSVSGAAGGSVKVGIQTITESCSPATLHPALSSAGLAQPTSCVDCHSSDGVPGTTNLVMVPVGLTVASSTDNVQPLRPMDHAQKSNAGTSFGDCGTCHKAPLTTPETFSGGVFHASLGTSSSPATCSACHSVIMPSAIVSETGKDGTIQMKHTSTSYSHDCTGCHFTPIATTAGGAITINNSTPSGYPAATHWSGGVFHKALTTQPKTCNDCHTGERPGTTTTSSLTTALTQSGRSPMTPSWTQNGSTIAGSAASQHMNHAATDSTTQVSGDCSVCHAADATNASAGFSKTDSFHVSVTTGVTACITCHDNGTTIDVPSGLVDASTSVKSMYTGATYLNAGTYDQILHTNINVAGVECVKCHTAPTGSTTGGTISETGSWAGAYFHKNVTALANGTHCADCHFNLMPTTAAITAYNHQSLITSTATTTTITTPQGTILTQDCASCHVYNATTPTWLGAQAGNHTAPFNMTQGCAGCHGPGGSYKNDLPSTTNWYASPTSNTVTTNTYYPTATFSNFRGGNKAKGAFNHDPSVLGLTALPDCINCHVQTTLGAGNAGTSWKGGFIFHTSNFLSTGTTWASNNKASLQYCSPCHSAQFTDGNGSTNHEGSTLNSTPSSQACAACHTYTAPTPTGTAPDYGGKDPSGC